MREVFELCEGLCAAGDTRLGVAPIAIAHESRTRVGEYEVVDVRLVGAKS